MLNQKMAKNHCRVYSDEEIFEFSANVSEDNTLVIQPVSKAPYLQSRYFQFFPLKQGKIIKFS